MKLKDILNEVDAKALKEEVTIPNGIKKRIKSEVIKILTDERLEFNPDYVEIKTPKAVNSLHIELPIIPSDSAKDRIIQLAKSNKLVPDGNDAISRMRGSKAISMSFKQI